MQYFQTQTARSISKPADRINHIWRAHYFRSVIGTEHYLFNAYKYFYRNPVEAGLSKSVEEYPYSTLHGLLGNRRLIIPVCRDHILFSSVEQTLRWLDTPPVDGHQEVMRKALRRREFKLPRSKSNGQQHPLEKELY